MDNKNYLNILKSIGMKPKKVQIRENKERVVLEQDTGASDMHTKIVQWFMKNPNPPDEKVHALAGEFGIDPDKLETHIYKILSDILSGGKSKDFKGEYDPKELAMGVKIEKEHTGSSLIALKIAKDHTAEIPDYYTRLKKMEKSAGIKESRRND